MLTWSSTRSARSDIQQWSSRMPAPLGPRDGRLTSGQTGRAAGLSGECGGIYSSHINSCDIICPARLRVEPELENMSSSIGGVSAQDVLASLNRTCSWAGRGSVTRQTVAGIMNPSRTLVQSSALRISPLALQNKIKLHFV